MAENKKNKKNVRFRYFIEKKFQTKFIFGFIILILLSSLITIGYMIYIDSKKYTKGVLFEEIIADYYKTTYLRISSKKIIDGLVKIKKTVKEFDKRISGIVFSIDEYISKVNRIEGDIKLGILKKKELVGEFSHGTKGNLVYYVDNLVKFQKMDNQEANRVLYELRAALFDFDFTNLEGNLDRLISLAQDNKEIYWKLENVKESFLIFKNTVFNAYSFLTEVPPFAKDVSLLLQEVSKNPNVTFDIEAVDSVSNHLNRLMDNISSTTNYGSVLDITTVQEGRKSYNLLQLYWKPVISLSLFQILLVSIFGLLLSHRIAGPVHRIKKELREISEGKKPLTHEIKLRKKDFLIDIANEINNTLKSISDRYGIK